MGVTNLFKKPIIWILLVCILALLVAGVYLRSKGTQPPTLPPQSLPQPKIETSVEQPHLKYVFSGTYPDFPKSLPVYQLSVQESLTPEFAEQLAQRLGFVTPLKTLPDQRYGQVFLYSERGKSLTLYPNPIIIKYLNPQKLETTRLGEDKLRETTEGFLKEKGLLPASANYVLVKTDYLKIGELDFTPVSAFSQAEVLAFYFNYQLDNYPLMGKSPVGSPIKVTINVDGSIRQALVVRFPSTFQMGASGTLQTAPQAFESLALGKGIITTLLAQKDEYLEVGPEYVLNEAQLTRVQLAYYYAPTQSTIQPVYVFSGTSKEANGNLVQVEVLAPALEKNYFVK